MGPKLSGLGALQVVKKKHRTRMLEFFIDVARECFNIGNFNSMMAIICECAAPGVPLRCCGARLPPPSPCLSPPAAGMNMVAWDYFYNAHFLVSRNSFFFFLSQITLKNIQLNTF